ncbi:pyridoxal phosphate-dependent transferase [Cantharellus anzutake]|uniref:pyridoxal phosphate-dependent transferase n=1 Tax=Cantharellus anzutake TaxID=1750568 RepID=UPI00190865DA|nr:pyridoxal phosphate-dependent transferase [Cantharellus anzutake]KAF8336574.1 pyridoxal phosphate-dependent transferase [Cantharellus anzutake]
MEIRTILIESLSLIDAVNSNQDTGVNASAAYQLIHDEVELDGSPSLNFASFVHTWMPDEALKLVVENIAKFVLLFYSDQDEYPATMQIHSRCISMLSHLWKAPKGSHVIGTATGGSSEAIMLGGLAMKKAWVERRKAAGKDYYHPNVIMGANAQVAIEKFARYFDVEAKLVPVTEEGGYYVDENTIGVFIILGSTYTGGFEDVQEMNDFLDKYEAETGISIPSMVLDAASGGFVAPFVYPGYKWGFDVPRVHSINTSGHKFGLTYVGLGWILWKDESLLHKDLIFELHYLGSTEQSYTLNFSRPSAPILEADLANARLLSRALEESGWYKCLSNIHIPYKKSSITGAIGSVIGDPSGRVDEDKAAFYQRGLPVVAFRFSDEFKQNYPHVQQSWIQNLLRQKQWIVPNYNMPPNVEKVEVLRIVVRESMNPDIIERVAADILEITEQLTKTDSGVFQMQLAFSSSNLSPNTIEHEIGKFKAESDAPREQQTYSRIC